MQRWLSCLSNTIMRRAEGFYEILLLLHRIIPVGEDSAQVDIHPFERATEIWKGALAGGYATALSQNSNSSSVKGCHHPLESCLVFRSRQRRFPTEALSTGLSQKKKR